MKTIKPTACLLAVLTASISLASACSLAIVEPEPKDTGGVSTDTGPEISDVVDWDDWQEKECNHGDIDTRPCGKCGKQVRTCSIGMRWNDWHVCEGELATAKGALDE